MPNDQLSVLLVTPDYPPPPGGIQTIVRNLEVGLDNLNIVVDILYIDPQDYDPHISDFIPRPRWRYSTRAFVMGKFVYQNAVYDRVQERINTFSPDLVHAMHIRNWSALIAANEARLPAVLSTYALELEEQNLATAAIDAADVVHAISEFTQDLVHDAARSAVETHLINPSIDVSEYRKAREQNKQSDETAPVVTIARFVNRKNIQTVINAWKRLDTEHIEGRKLIIAGDGPNRQQLEKQAAERDDIRFPGWVNGDEKRELLAKSAVFVMVPQRYQFDVEGFGIVYIEAQAAGTPVIGSKHGGAPEAIGDAGIVVSDETDPDEVADAITTMLDDRRTRKVYERNAADRIDQFSIPTISKKYTTLYENLLENDSLS